MLRTIFAIVILLVTAMPVAATPPSVKAARAYRVANGHRILAEFAELLRIPNVAEDPRGLRRTAEAIRDGLNRRGVRSELLEHTGAAPVVLGVLKVPRAERTLGIYVHYDGQPVDAAGWTHPPFEPTLYTGALDRGGQPREFPELGEAIDPEWRIYARSSADDKAPLGAWFAALDALAEARIRLTSNLVFLFEGEEEAGSIHLQQYLETHRERLKDVDLWLICDGPTHPSRRPQLVFGVRGYTGLDITVYGAERYLHSGHYGNWAPNPALELSRLLAGMKNEHGRVMIPGFHRSVLPLTDNDRRALDSVPDVDRQLRQEFGLHTSEAANAPLMQRLLLPSLNVRGMQSASVGPTARNVIPTRAQASIDIRLVKGNDPESMLDLVEQYVRSRGYTIVRQDPDHETRMSYPRLARIDRRPGYPAVRTSMELDLVQPVIHAAEQAAGEPVILMPSLGGSLPLYLFADLLQRPLVIVPIANHDDNQHAPDENLRVANLWYGIDLFSALLTMP